MAILSRFASPDPAKKPVNGILVAVSVTDLQGEADEIAVLAKSLRERIDEVMGDWKCCCRCIC